MTFITRFAPSPTGPLHVGHAYSALLAYDLARSSNGRFLLRIEDTDTQRCRAAWETQIYDDLAWLGLSWETPVLRQSERGKTYDTALSILAQSGLIYPCSCTRSDIRAALSAPQEGGAIATPYPGTCQNRSMSDRGPNDALRLDLGKALALLNGRTLGFQEIGDICTGSKTLDSVWMLANIGDIVLGRKDIQSASYVLSAVIDDAKQKISHVVRGADLFETTYIQILLQALLDLPTPIYLHHRLIRDDAGKRLAKRDDARAIAKYRQDGLTSQDIRTRVGL